MEPKAQLASIALRNLEQVFPPVYHFVVGGVQQLGESFRIDRPQIKTASYLGWYSGSLSTMVGIN